MAHGYLSWGQENWDGVGHNAVPISERRLLGSVRAQHLQNSWLLKLYFQKPGSWNQHLFDVAVKLKVLVYFLLFIH